MPKFTLLATKMEVCQGISGGDFEQYHLGLLIPPCLGNSNLRGRCE